MTKVCIDPTPWWKALTSRAHAGRTTKHRIWKLSFNCRDHAGGNKGFCELVPGLTVLGGRRDNIPGCTRSVQDGERVTLGTITIECIETP